MEINVSLWQVGLSTKLEKISVYLKIFSKSFRGSHVVRGR